MGKPKFAIWALVALVALVAAMYLAACSSSTSTVPTLTPQPPTPTLPVAPTVVATATPAATPLSGHLEVASTVQLVDVISGTTKTLYESRTVRAWDAVFEDDRIVVRKGGDTLQFRIDGSPLLGQTEPECRDSNGSAVVAGRPYAGVPCGDVSPDLRWMTYHVNAGEVTLPSGYTVPLWDQWLIDLRTSAARMIQSGLVQCGGCDARYGPRWSPDSRYVAYAETGGEARRFLTDAASGRTRPIGNGSDVTLAPQWSPKGDMLLYPSSRRGATRLEDMARGTARDLELAWPVTFDQSGTLVYSPAWSPGPKERDLVTTIVEIATGKVLATVPGAPPTSHLWTGSRAVSATPDGVFAALQQARGCDGTAIYRDGTLQQCVKGGREGQTGPQGLVAVARTTGTAGSARGPGFETTSIDRFDIDIISPSGQSQTVVSGAFSLLQAPLMVWNAGGTRLLVLWPRAVGL